MTGRKKADQIMIPFKDHEWGVLICIPIVKLPIRSTNIEERRVQFQYTPEDVKCQVCGQRYTNASLTKCPGRRR